MVTIKNQDKKNLSGQENIKFMSHYIHDEKVKELE